MLCDNEIATPSIAENNLVILLFVRFFSFIALLDLKTLVTMYPVRGLAKFNKII